ncbi:MAG: VanW family protein [Oscillospiraceae bacterium]|nr:VanW family protein [Oscillospiraceae bacterium]
MQLQENKAHNLALAAPLVNGILIQPGETFSLWRLVGNTSAKRGYKEGLTIKQHAPSHDVGGGMCQLSNLIHWMVLHSPLDIIERHHHNDLDLFPDFGRQVPFGCGTSILYNYLDYRVQNNSEQTFQLLVSTNDTHLCGELRAQTVLDLSVHIVEEDAHFVCVDGQYYRRNRVVRRVNDKRTGNLLDAAIIDQANARVMYDPSFIAVSQVV